MRRDAPVEVALPCAVLHRLLKHVFARVAARAYGPVVGIGAQDESMLVILAHDIVAQSHRLHILVDVDRLGGRAHIGPRRAHIDLVVHDPVLDAAMAAAVVAAGQVVDDGCIGVDALHGSHVGHRVVAPAVVGVAEHMAQCAVAGAGCDQDDGTHGNVALLIVGEMAVPLGNGTAIDVIGLAAIAVLHTVGKDGALGNQGGNHDVACDVFGV